MFPMCVHSNLLGLSGGARSLTRGCRGGGGGILFNAAASQSEPAATGWCLASGAAAGTGVGRGCGAAAVAAAFCALRTLSCSRVCETEMVHLNIRGGASWFALSRISGGCKPCISAWVLPAPHFSAALWQLQTWLCSLTCRTYTHCFLSNTNA